MNVIEKKVRELEFGESRGKILEQLCYIMTHEIEDFLKEESK